MFKIVIIDPGHGGKDNGAMWGYAEEDDINLIVSFLLRCELEKHDSRVLLTREKDEFVSLLGRSEFANRVGADLFVSIHCDAFHKTTANGMSVHVHPESSKTTINIARKINVLMAAHFPDHRNRGLRRSDFSVLRRTIMPAVLIECEFLSNPEMRRFLREPENQLALAQAISRGIV